MPAKDTPSSYATPPTPDHRRPRPALITRKPTGKPAPPLILVEGGEKSGKTYSVAEFTADERISRCWWIEWGEKPIADEYGSIPGADFDIVEHDGEFDTVLALVEQISKRAWEHTSDTAAPMIVIDSMHGEWEALKRWGHRRKLEAPSIQRRLQRNPNVLAEDLEIPSNIWNDINARHERLMRLLQDWPGIAVVISRGKEVTAFDDNGRPIDGVKVYRVDGQKNLAYDVSAWVRMSRDQEPIVVGCRSVRAPLAPSESAKKPRQFHGFGWLVFDVIGFQPEGAAAPTPLPIDWDQAIADANGDRDRLLDVWNAALYALAPDEVLERIKKAGEAAKATRAEQQQGGEQ